MTRAMTHAMSQLELIMDWVGMGCLLECKGSTAGDCTMLTMGCLGKEPKPGKVQGGLGKNKYGNIEG